MKRHTWRRVAAATVVLGMLAAACGGDDDDAAEAADDGAASADSGSDSADDGAESGDSGSDDMDAESDDMDAEAESAEITILGTLKTEIAPQFEEAVAAYNASQDTYTLNIVPLADNFLQIATSMYTSGNAPTLMVMSQEIPEFQDRLLDLSGTPAVEHALPGTLNQATLDDGRIIGVPQTIEAYGLLYNQAVLDEAVGGIFDPASIQTRSDLEALMVQVEALDSTQAAIHLSPMDWSLGAHLTNMLYSPQAVDRTERLGFIDSLEAGEVSLSDDAVFNGWLDTVDLFLAHNQLADSPLAAEYDDGVTALANGDVGFWFMGNWALPNLSDANPDGNFGVLPVPISDNAGDYGNAQISVGVPSYIVVDADQSSEAQQQGAIDFITWLTTSDEGLDFYVNEFQFLPAYDTVAEPPADTLSQQILGYASSGNTLEWINSLYPADGWPTFGATMQQYIVDQADRASVAEQFEDYWTSVE